MIFFTALLFLPSLYPAQNFSGTYKIDQLLKRIDNPDTFYVVNFWATWCKPCVEELPAFDSLQTLKNKSLKILLVSLDFSEELDKKVKPFLKKHKIQSECVLLDEVNGNDFINKISASWSGAIPATLFKKGNEKDFVEAKLKLSQLQSHIKELE
ncbi:hypothetical protein CNR22_22690 [Sphingobacteriaceae bacterium]|nr:hypothetical protein CNR22_22690 [Sphingobacteriaceae bacterium]